MTIEEEGYLNHEVVLTEDFGDPNSDFYLEKGRIGLCTADLKEHDVFAVWFKDPIGYREDGSPLYWVTFKPWTEREKFDILR